MKLFFISLGCDKNLVDSEKMLALLVSHDIEITDEPEEAEIIIVNTCAFIRDAKEESIEVILEMAGLKKNGACQVLIVSGCLAQRYAEEIQKEIPEVDAVMGTTAYDQIWDVVQKAREGMRACFLRDLGYLPVNLTRRLPSVSSYTSYLKIAEGCDKCCTYCIIPSLRGNYRSVPMEELVEEASLLAEAGTKELILVAQETTVYGVDIYGKRSLPELLGKLCQIQGIEWIRLLYCYPEEITEELIETVKREPKICHYFDLPIQHCNDEILRRMGRRTTKTELVRRIRRIREMLPDVALRTTLISGFPGETCPQHEECVAFVADMKFDRLGVFPFSAEEGTPAAQFPEQISESTKQRWADEIMEAEQDVIFRKNEQLIGQRFQVLVDGYLPEEHVYTGRTYRDAPGVDGCVFFSAQDGIMSGTLLTVTVTDARGYDLVGEVYDEEGSD